MIRSFIVFSAICASLVFVPASQAASCGTAAAPTACSATIGTMTLDFNSFSFFSTLSGVGAGTQINAADVNIDLITTADSWSIVLTPNTSRQSPNDWLFTGTQLQQMFVAYQVDMTGIGQIVNVGAGFTDQFTGSNGQFGAGSQTKDVCTGGACGSGGTIVSSVNLNDQTGTAGVTGSYAGYTAPQFGQVSPGTFWVRDTMSLQANNKTIQGFEFSNTFTSDVPEPGTLLLVGGALIWVGLVRRKVV
jgi:hypothetical protein